MGKPTGFMEIDRVNEVSLPIGERIGTREIAKDVSEQPSSFGHILEPIHAHAEGRHPEFLS